MNVKPKPIVFYVFVIGILIVPAYGSDHWDFDGDIGQGWHFEGTPQWHLDCNVSHSSSCSMRSGEILPFSGPTSIWREVQGPAIISFWWKADSIQVCTDPAVMCKGLFFLVDGITQLTCNSADWKEARFPLADGIHKVEWIFKPRSDRKGIGWLDNVGISPSPIATYNNHSLNFEIPYGWDISKEVQKDNDTQIVLSNDTSTIRIDLIQSSDSAMNKIVRDYLSKSNPDTEKENASWKLFFQLTPWYVGDSVCEYYARNIIKTGCLGGSGSGVSIKPDGVEYAGVATNYGQIKANPIEWIFAWTKPDYNDEIIGIHGIFTGNYAQEPLEWNGSPRDYFIPRSLWRILTTITKG